MAYIVLAHESSTTYVSSATRHTSYCMDRRKSLRIKSAASSELVSEDL